MAGTINKVMLLGTLVEAPTFRATQSGAEVASMTIETSDSWNDKNSGEKKTRSEFHKVSVMNEGFVNILKKSASKGSLVAIEGKIQTRKYQDKSGVDKYITEVVLQGWGSSLILPGQSN